MELSEAIKKDFNISSLSLRGDKQNLDEIYNNLKQIRSDIMERIEFVENTDLKMTVITYTIYEKQYEFTKKLEEIKIVKNEVLQRTDITASELSLQLHPLDGKIFQNEIEHAEKINRLGEEKIEQQQRMEEAMSLLDNYFEDLQAMLAAFSRALEYQKNELSKSESNLLQEKFKSTIDEFQGFIHFCKNKQVDGWKVQSSEIMLADALERKGLKMTKSGLLITESGHSITYSEARDKGYFNDMGTSNSRFFHHLHQNHDETDKVDPPPSVQSDCITESVTRGSSESSGMTSQDVKYLKRVVGKPLTLALAEITAKHPRDPIHYLGHFLFKYRYNQDMEEIKKMEVDELENERKALAERRWHKFVEEEAGAAVLEMVIRAEEIAYENEMKRIEAEMALMAEEQEDEARDKFDEYLKDGVKN